MGTPKRMDQSDDPRRAFVARTRHYVGKLASQNMSPIPEGEYKLLARRTRECTTPEEAMALVSHFWRYCLRPYWNDIRGRENIFAFLQVSSYIYHRQFADTDEP